MPRIFKISKDELLTLYTTYQARGVEDGMSTLIGHYLKKSFKTGVFQMTRVGLLREATWARKNEFGELADVLSNWADLAEEPTVQDLQPSATE